MAQLFPVVYDGQHQRRLAAGDLLVGSATAILPTDATVTLAYTAAMLYSQYYVRNPAGVSTDTFPSADALISTQSSGLGNISGAPIGMSFVWRVINLSVNLLTGAVTANTGATMVRGNVLASTFKDFLIQITNGTPLQTALNLTTVNASPVVTGFSATQIANLSVGQIVTKVVAGLQGLTIVAVNATALSVTMSGNASASASTNTITFSPTYTITGLAA